MKRISYDIKFLQLDDIEISRLAFTVFLDAFKFKNYKPVHIELTRSLGSLFKINDLSSGIWFPSGQYGVENSGCEIFVDNSNILVLIRKDGYYSDDPDSKEYKPGLIAAYFSGSEGRAGELDKFIDAIIDKFNVIEPFFKDAEVSLDDWNIRDSNISDYLHLNDLSPSSVLSIPFNKTRNLNFTKPKYDDIDVKASRVIANGYVRQFLLKSVQIGANKKKDLTKEFREFDDELIFDLEKLGIISKRKIVQCTKNNRVLTEIKDLNSFNMTILENMICPNCGKSYTNEDVDDVISVTEYGRKLLTESLWMTILVTSSLVKKGVNSDDIVWSLTEDSDEIDIAICQGNEMIVFELKDKPFDIGNAYPLSSRRIKFNADKAVIITTSTVAKEVKKHFEDLHNSQLKTSQSRYLRFGDSAEIPIYIEGLNNIDNKLDKVLSYIERKQLYKLCQEIKLFSPLPVDRLILHLIEDYEEE